MMAHTVEGETEEPGFGRDRDQGSGRDGDSRREWQFRQGPGRRVKPL